MMTDTSSESTTSNQYSKLEPIRSGSYGSLSMATSRTGSSGSSLLTTTSRTGAHGTPNPMSSGSSNGLTTPSESLRSLRSSWKSRRTDEMAAEVQRKCVAPRTSLSKDITEGLTINKLKDMSQDSASESNNVLFVGRDREVETLGNCFSRMYNMHNESEQSTASTKKELVFIKGYSGIGKTALAETLRKSVTLPETPGIYVRGKCCNEPYSGISSSFGELCRRILVRQSHSTAQIGQAILRDLGRQEVQQLIQIIPELFDILPEDERRSLLDTATRKEAETYSFQAGQERWKYALRVLMRVLSSHLPPIILVLDDLQWADESSLSVIDYLLSDSTNPNPLMILGCVRCNQVVQEDENEDGPPIVQNIVFEVDVTPLTQVDPVTKLMDDLKQKSDRDKYGFNMTLIELGNLDLSNLNAIIMSMLSLDDEEETKGLAEICFKRTLGNPQFLIEFVKMLEEEKLLQYNFGLLRWTWDESFIENTTMASANTVDLLYARMAKLPPNAQVLLQFAACLGSSFKRSVLVLVWEKSGQQGDDFPSLLKLLKTAKFVEDCGADVYRWSHDNLREAALPDASFRFEAGSRLLFWLGEEDLEDSLFEVANLVNPELTDAGLKESSNRKAKFAEINLRAALKAKSISAFSSAAAYATKGILLLPDDKWTTHRGLTLRLYTLAAEMELALGGNNDGYTYSREVVSRDDCTPLEKLPVYMAEINKLSTMDVDYKGAIALCLSVLKEFDCILFRSRALLPTKAIYTLMRTIRKGKKTPMEVYTSLKPMESPEQEAIMHVLTALSYACYMDKNTFLHLLCAPTMVKKTLKYGVSAQSGVAFATLGLLTVAVSGDFEAGAKCATAARMMQNLVPSRHFEATAVFISNTMIMPWTKPLNDCSRPFYDGYISGMRSGNLTDGLWNYVAHHVMVPYQTGRPLGSIVANLSVPLAQMEEAKLTDHAITLRGFWQTIMNLTGDCNTVVLQGEVFDCDEYKDELSLPHHSAFFAFLSMQLLVFFGETEAAAKLALEKGAEFQKHFPGHFLSMLGDCFRGLALYSMARKTKVHKYKTQANAIQKSMQKWRQQGNPNVKHFHHLLSAESADLKKDYKSAETLYKQAVVSAGRTGHLHHAALSCEKYADFLMRRMSNDKDVLDYRREESVYYRQEAIRFYKAWGALKKVEILKATKDI